MKYRTIGSTGIDISEIGLGCWTLGGLNWEDGRFSNGWSPIDPDEARRAIRYALDRGVTHFDNADVYGNGAAERLLAEGLDEQSKDIVISSKVGWFSGTALHAYEPRHIYHQCEQSLINLKRDYIDIYYFHHGNFGKEDCYLDDACAIMEKLRDEGKIRCVGLSAYSERDFSRLVPKIMPEVVQSWAHIMDYHFVSLNSPLMKLCTKYKMSFIAFSPLNQGILLNKYSSLNPPQFPDGDHRNNSKKFKQEYLAYAEKGIANIKESLGCEDKALIRLALQFILYHDNVAGVIPGFRNIEQVKMNLSAANSPLNGKEMSLIRNAFTAGNTLE